MIKRTKINNFGGLAYITLTNVPVKESELGDIINLEPKQLERIVSEALIKNKIPIRGAEFRIMKSAISLSNEAIARELGISRNTVLKWGKEVEKRLPRPYEMLIRALVADYLNIALSPRLKELRAKDEAKVLEIKAA